MPCYQSTNPRAAHSPLRSCQWGKPAYLVLGVSEEFKARALLANATRDMPLAEQRLATACKTLGEANRMRGPMRRYWKAQAFRSINLARAGVREARRALAAAQQAMLAFAAAA